MAEFDPCPFLGCAEDRASVCSYATGINVCFAGSRKRSRYRTAPLNHQESYCLAAYGECNVYQDTLVALGNGLSTPTRPSPLFRLFHRLFPPRPRRPALDGEK